MMMMMMMIIIRSNAKDYIVGNCEDIEKSAGDIKKRSFC